MRKRPILAMAIIAVLLLLSLTSISNARIGDTLVDKLIDEISKGPSTYSYKFYLWYSITGGYYVTHFGKLSVSEPHEGNLAIVIRRPGYVVFQKLTITPSNDDIHYFFWWDGVGDYSFKISYWTLSSGELNVYFRTTKSGYVYWEFSLELDWFFTVLQDVFVGTI